MVFGHETTSHDLNLTGNNFIYAGCTQPRGDKAGIAFMCPNGERENDSIIRIRFAHPCLLHRPPIVFHRLIQPYARTHARCAR